MKKIQLVLALIGLSVAGAAHAGGMVSSGGEFITTEQNPWFIGPQGFNYCIDASANDFSLSAADAAPLIQQALTSWKDSLTAFNPRPTSSYVLDGLPHNLTFDYHKNEECTADTDLTFYLGKTPSFVASALQDLAHYTISFARQTSFDDTTGRAKGFIWVVPDRGPLAYQGPRAMDQNMWSEPTRFHNVILHELGHVFGLGHSKFNIMREDFPANLVRYDIHGYLDARNLSAVLWYSAGKEICGQAATDAVTITDLLGTEVGSHTHFCMTPDTGKNSATLTAELRDDTGKVTKIAMKVTNQLYRNDGDTFDLIGRYVMRPIPGTIPGIAYMDEGFINILAPDVVATYTVGGAERTAIIATIPGMGLRVSLVGPKGRAEWLELRLPNAWPWVN